MERVILEITIGNSSDSVVCKRGYMEARLTLLTHFDHSDDSQ